MLPFVRTPTELLEAKKIMTGVGLVRSGSFKIWMMVEVPANVLILEKFLGVGIDGVSIGSNDLTQLLYGLDRDNPKLAPYFDEQADAVSVAIQRVVETCKEHGVTSSICGQAPSIYPEFTQSLVEWGITSISVNPDAVESTREVIARTEYRLVTGKYV